MPTSSLPSVGDNSGQHQVLGHHSDGSEEQGVEEEQGQLDAAEKHLAEVQLVSGSTKTLLSVENHSTPSTGGSRLVPLQEGTEACCQCSKSRRCPIPSSTRNPLGNHSAITRHLELHGPDVLQKDLLLHLIAHTSAKLEQSWDSLPQPRSRCKARLQRAFGRGPGNLVPHFEEEKLNFPSNFHFGSSDIGSISTCCFEAVALHGRSAQPRVFNYEARAYKRSNSQVYGFEA